jgi:hypothetical protein
MCSLHSAQGFDVRKGKMQEYKLEYDKILSSNWNNEKGATAAHFGFILRLFPSST